MKGRPILQISSGFKIVEIWESVKQISTVLRKNRTAFDQSLRDKYRAHGYWWIYQHEWDQGVRPNKEKQIRRKPIYAYKNRKFIGAYQHSVEAAKELNLSACNIRLVADPNHSKKILKGYTFNYKPKNKSEKYEAEPLYEEELIMPEI